MLLLGTRKYIRQPNVLIAWTSSSWSLALTARSAFSALLCHRRIKSQQDNDLYWCTVEGIFPGELKAQPRCCERHSVHGKYLIIIIYDSYHREDNYLVCIRKKRNQGWENIVYYVYLYNTNIFTYVYYVVPKHFILKYSTDFYIDNLHIRTKYIYKYSK